MCYHGDFRLFFFVISILLFTYSCLKDPKYNVSANFIGKYKGISTNTSCCTPPGDTTITTIDSNYIAEVIVFQKKGQIKINGRGYILAKIDGNSYYYTYSSPQKFVKDEVVFNGDTLSMDYDYLFYNTPQRNQTTFTGLKMK